MNDLVDDSGTENGLTESGLTESDSDPYYGRNRYDTAGSYGYRNRCYFHSCGLDGY